MWCGVRVCRVRVRRLLLHSRRAVLLSVLRVNEVFSPADQALSDLVRRLRVG